MCERERERERERRRGREGEEEGEGEGEGGGLRKCRNTRRWCQGYQRWYVGDFRRRPTFLFADTTDGCCPFSPARQPLPAPFLDPRPLFVVGALPFDPLCLASAAAAFQSMFAASNGSMYVFERGSSLNVTKRRARSASASGLVALALLRLLPFLGLPPLPFWGGEPADRFPFS